jgi:hypothetical protein
MDGRRAPRSSARSRFVAPAATPLISAMTTGSADESFRVRLLSKPHTRHATAISKPPASIRIPWFCQDSTAAPASIEAAPSRSFRSTFSRTTNHAIAMVASPSRFNNNEPDAAEVLTSPSIRNSGPTTPPNTTLATNHGESARRSGASAARSPSAARPTRQIASPVPAPKYRSPARSCGSFDAKSNFANGADAPNRSADASARGTPGHWKPCVAIVLVHASRRPCP